MLARLESFVAGGFTLQAPPVRAALGLAALLVLKGASPSFTPAVPGAENPLDRYQTSLADVSGRIGSSTYENVVARVQRDADDELGPGRIVVLNRAMPDRLERERLGNMLLGSRAALAIADAGDEPSGFSRVVDADEDGIVLPRKAYGIAPGTVCVVAGIQPTDTAVGVLGEAARGAGVSTADVHLWSLRREVGSCLMGGPGPAADAFAALLARRDAPDSTLVGLMAAAAGDDGPDEARAAAITAAGAQDPDGLSWARVAALAERISGGQRPQAGPASVDIPTELTSQARPASASPPEPDEEPEEEAYFRP